MTRATRKPTCPKRPVKITTAGSSLSMIALVSQHLLAMLLLLINLSPTLINPDQRCLQSTLVARRDFMKRPALIVILGIFISLLLPTLLKDGVTGLTLLFLLIPIFLGFWASLSRVIDLNAELISQKVFRRYFSQLFIPSFDFKTRTISPLIRPPCPTA